MSEIPGIDSTQNEERAQRMEKELREESNKVRFICLFRIEIEHEKKMETW